MKARSRLLLIAPCLVVGLLLSVHWVAFSQPASNPVEHGSKLNGENGASLKPGATSHTEVTNKPGIVCASLPRQCATTCDWQVKGGGTIWWYMVLIDSGGVSRTDFTPGGWRGYFIAFDGSRAMSCTELESVSAQQSLHQYRYVWTQRKAIP